MKKHFKIFSVIFSVMISLTLIPGCGNSSSNQSAHAYDLYIYSSKGETAAKMEAMCKEYESLTGVKIKLQVVGSGTDHLEPLRTQMNSNEKPSIFSIQGLRELTEWEMNGSVLDFNKIDSQEFKTLAEGVPQKLRLTSDGKNNYGIPYNLEGYGYIVDKQMLSDLIGQENTESFLEDIRDASYQDFQNFVNAVTKYIENATATTVSINGKNYDFSATKKGLVKNLTGVFSVAGSERWTYCDHLINVAMGTVFDSPETAKNATDTEIDATKNALIKYAQALDFQTSNACGDSAKASRSAEFINATTNNYNKSIQRFAQGKALFLQQGNWANTNIKEINAELAERLEILPIKLPLDSTDIKRSDITVEKFNRSVPVYVPNYFVINSKVSEKEQKLAQDFLLWLNTSEIGQKYVIEEFNFIPYNAANDLILKDSLNNSILEYQKKGDTLPAAYHGLPESWSKETVGLFLMENYMIKSSWNNSDYAKIAEFAIAKWKEIRK